MTRITHRPVRCDGSLPTTARREFFIAGIKIIGSFIILCGVNVWLTLIMFTIVPFIVIAGHLLQPEDERAVPASSGCSWGRSTPRWRTVSWGCGWSSPSPTRTWRRRSSSTGNQVFYNVKRHRYFYMGGFEASNRLFDGLMNLLVLVAGALFMIKGWIQPADLVAYMLYVGTLITSIRRLVQFAEQFQQGMTGVERFFQVMDADVDIFDEPRRQGNSD